MKVLSPQLRGDNGMLTKLNKDLDDLYELLYENYPSITEDDYKQFGSYLGVLIETLKGLHSAYHKSVFHARLKDNNDRLRMNISAIEEIDHDIRCFKIKLRSNPRYEEVLDKAKSM
ncbi:hypothetical protein [Parabacteroides sp.]